MRGNAGKNNLDFRVGETQSVKMTTKLLTIPKAAEFLKIGTSTLRRYLRRRLLPRIILPGGDQRISAKDLEKFIQKRRT